jgi:thiamine transport system ATP-binding protein
MATSSDEVPVLSVEQVSVRFGAHQALDAIDLEVGSGRVLALLGPSGCGKTTLLRVIAGLQAPTGGRVLLDGADLAGVAPHRRGIGLMFQEYALFPHRDVAANVGFGLRVRGVSKAATAARVAEVLELVGLPGYGRRAVGPLSGGEQQRVALARSLAPSPRVLMLDEPLGALDRSLRERLVLDLQQLFRDLAITVVYVTHDQGEALALADEVAVLHAGTVAQVGAPAAVWGAPADERVAAFLGFTNLLDVTVVDGRVVSAWGEIEGAPAVAVGSARLLVRPEAVVVRPADGTAAPGTTEGRVAGRLFRGSAVQLQVVAASGARLEAVVDPVGAPALGDAVTVRIDGRGVVPLG